VYKLTSVQNLRLRTPQYSLIQRGKAWEIWSCVMTSGRQMADTWAAVPNRNKSTCMSGYVIACDEIYVAFPHLSTASYLYKHWGQPVNLYPSTCTHTHTHTHMYTNLRWHKHG